MEFKDVVEMLNFYKKYAYVVGFPVKERNSKSREGGRIGNTSGCSKLQPIIQMGCRARITASSDIFGVWRINNVHLDHNHEISPSRFRLYQCNRQLNAHVKRKLQVNDLTGISLHKSYNSAIVEADGYVKMSCVENDCRNYIEQVRRLKLGEEDVVAIQSYFYKMQAQCPGFYFSMDLDDES
ncbi:protein FAR1-RELATED SEQUENCE 5-like [Olea europaea var. sylvestris]|uniref:protein FAR1-RELATED SEQUENCE 5-like n=1 Tax=Olea europaea var. sylvestris TaxID=158386 RepID=UPI000C1D63A2|nr:protein FAR1-RELATED SEQUENCE 5-like [Olea europaea var. sylvestris]